MRNIVHYAAITLAFGLATSQASAGDMQPPSEFDAFVKKVGIDMSRLATELRREWFEAPRVGIDDCSIHGAHAEHGHGPAGDEPAVKQAGAVETRSDR